jgi:hypothetical protein
MACTAWVCGRGASAQVYLPDIVVPVDIVAQNETFQVNLYYGDPGSTSETCDYSDTITSIDETIAAVANKVWTTVALANPPTLGSPMTITVVG